jgi:NADPH:quinone reductase-like Zn-dependent oxidoreductase
MKAAVRTRYGPPEVVRIAEVDKPPVRDHDVLVKVHVTTVNRTDCGFRSAKPFIVRFFSGLLRPKATILGTEFAGVVEAVGRSVKSFEVGDDVFGYSERRFGAHAEYLSIPEDGPLATMPANVTYEEVAPSTEGSHYALACITKDGQTYDVVFDAVGKSSFGRCKRLLKPGGFYLSTDLGPFSQNPILALITPLFGGRKAMMPIPPKYDQERVRRFKEMIEAGEFKPVIDRRYRLDQIVEAYRYVETGQKIGNVVISVDPLAGTIRGG